MKVVFAYIKNSLYVIYMLAFMYASIYNILRLKQKQTEIKMDANINILRTQNKTWGFYGAVMSFAGDYCEGRSDAAERAWDEAFLAISKATGGSDESVRIYLDRPSGRHFADRVIGFGLQKAIDDYMTWTVSPSQSRKTGRPQGYPLLWVEVAEIEHVDCDPD